VQTTVGPTQARTITQPPSQAPLVIREETEICQPANPQANLDLPQLWSELVEAVGRASPFTRSYLLEAHPVSITKTLFTIGFDPEFEDHMSLVDNSKNHALLQTKLAELGRPNIQIKFIKAENPRQPVPLETLQPKPTLKPVAKPTTSTAQSAPAREKPVPVSLNKEDFKKDPLIQKALEIFKGQVVDVRG